MKTTGISKPLKTLCHTHTHTSCTAIQTPRPTHTEASLCRQHAERLEQDSYWSGVRRMCVCECVCVCGWGVDVCLWWTECFCKQKPVVIKMSLLTDCRARDGEEVRRCEYVHNVCKCRQQTSQCMKLHIWIAVVFIGEYVTVYLYIFLFSNHVKIWNWQLALSAN